MPTRPPRACQKPLCRQYSSDGSSYCADHKPKSRSGWADYRKKNGGTRHTAGYGHDWDKLRESILIRDRHLCQTCLKLGQFTSAKHVDHITPKSLGGTNCTSNLQSLCWPCHKRKTQKEAADARALKNLK